MGVYKQHGHGRQRQCGLLNETQQRIVNLLRGGKLHIDEIAVRLSLGQQELISELMELEILGRVKSMPGKIYSL